MYYLIYSIASYTISQQIYYTSPPLPLSLSRPSSSPSLTFLPLTSSPLIPSHLLCLHLIPFSLHLLSLPPSPFSTHLLSLFRRDLMDEEVSARQQRSHSNVQCLRAVRTVSADLQNSIHKIERTMFCDANAEFCQAVGAIL